MKTTTINRKIVVMLGIVLVLTFGAMLTSLLLTEEHLKFEKTKEYVDELSKTTIQAVTFSMSEGSTDISPFVQRFKNFENIKNIRILATDKIREKSSEKMDAIEKKVVNLKKAFSYNEVFNNVEVFRCVEPILADKSCIGCHSEAQIGDPMAVVSIRYSMTDTFAAINSQRINAILMALGTIIIIFIVVLYFLKKQVIKDLLRVVENIKILSTGNVNVNISTYRTDEIGGLINSINILQNSMRNQAESATQIAEGNLNIDIPLLSNDDILGKAMRKVKDNLSLLSQDIDELCKFAIIGELGKRADFTIHHGDYQKIIKGINDILDNVTGPLNVAANYIDRIAKGNIPNKITIVNESTNVFKGDFNKLKNNINQCIDAINLLVNDSLMLTKAAAEGKLDVRADISKHSGDFNKIISGVNNTLDNVIGPLNVAAEYVDRISKGDIPPKITENYKGDFNEIKNNLNQCIDAINLLVIDSKMLVADAIEEKFDSRASIINHSGDFRLIIDGVNKTLDVIVNKIFWFEQLLDAIPSPISVTDLDMNWTFINKAAEGVAGKTRKEIIGKHCSNWGADICGTEKCGVHGLRNGRATSFFNQPGLDMDFKVDSAFIINTIGDKIGHIEIVNDITEITKKAQYNKIEIDRISKNLKLIAQGNFNIDLKAAEGDNYTNSEKANFLMIYNDLEIAKNSIVALADDTMMLSESAVEGQLDKRADTSKHQGEFKKIVEGFNSTLDNVIGPLNIAAEYVDKIAKGDIPEKITDDFKGDFNEIKNNLNQCIDTVSAILHGTGRVINNMQNGNLIDRGDASLFSGDWSSLVNGINGIIESLVKPINFTAEYVDRLSKGDIPPKITDEYKGDFNKIKNNLNDLIDSTIMITEVANKLSLGNTNVTLSKRSPNDLMIENLIKVIDNNKNNAEIVRKISNGNLNIDIVVMSENDIMAQSCIILRDTLKSLVEDTMMLAKSAEEGILDNRADENKHQGDFKSIIKGINKSLDNVIGPLNVAAEYVDRISKGDIPKKISDDYHGDFNEIKNNLNTLIDSNNEVTNIANEISKGKLNNIIKLRSDNDNLMIAMQTMTDAINNLADDTFELSQAAVAGKLDIRADAKKHEGDFRKIINGINRTLDSVISPLNVAAEYVDRIAKGDIPPKINDEYQGDFNEIKNNLNQCIDAVNNLVYDTAMLAEAATNGNLSVRADTAKHNGEYGNIIKGINNTLDHVIGPLNVAAKYIDSISKGNIPLKITDNYLGDFNLIKNNINLLIDSINNVTMISKDIAKGKLDNEIVLRSQDDDLMVALQTMTNVITTLVSDVYSLSQSAIEGHLEKRADSSKHQGDFQSIVEGVNKTLDNILEPLTEAGQVLGMIAYGDLTTRMIGEYKGDLNDFKMNINMLASSLTDVISQIRESVEQSAAAASQISASAESLAAASNQQSAQADDVASAVEEMSRTVIDNARSASHTAEVAKKNGIVAQEGSKVVEQTVLKMRDIALVVQNSADNIKKLGESSQKIGEIVSVIDDIADQTNLLALNAAIEAARAGEQGRGFAVVADEVRKLAERTTNATKEIAKMIKGIQSETDMAVKAMNQGTIEVQNGIVLADKAGSSLENILNSTNIVLDMINQIASASEQQSATSEQIAKNVMSISKVTNESTKRVEEVARTSEHLASITDHLKALMEQFKVESEFSNNKAIKLNSAKNKNLLPEKSYY